VCASRDLILSVCRGERESRILSLLSRFRFRSLYLPFPQESEKEAGDGCAHGVTDLSPLCSLSLPLVGNTYPAVSSLLPLSCKRIFCCAHHDQTKGTFLRPKRVLKKISSLLLFLGKRDRERKTRRGNEETESAT